MTETIEVQAGRLLRYTVEDLRARLNFEDDPVVLKRARELLEHRGAGYGSGVTAWRMIATRLKKLEKKPK